MGGEGSEEAAELPLGDWRLLLLSSLSSLPFSCGVASGVGSSEGLLTEGLRRCLFKYALDDDECGSSALGPCVEADVSWR